MRKKMMRRAHALAVLRKSKHTPVERTRTKISIFQPIDGHAHTSARVPCLHHCFAELDATRIHQSLSARQVEQLNRNVHLHFVCNQFREVNMFSSEELKKKIVSVVSLLPIQNTSCWHLRVFYGGQSENEMLACSFVEEILYARHSNECIYSYSL